LKIFPNNNKDVFLLQVMAADMSYRLGWIDDTLPKRIVKLLKQAKLPIAPPEEMTVDKFKSIMAVSTFETNIVATFSASDFKIFVREIVGI
jgi:hypothetical protein